VEFESRKRDSYLLVLPFIPASNQETNDYATLARSEYRGHLHLSIEQAVPLISQEAMFLINMRKVDLPSSLSTSLGLFTDTLHIPNR